MSRPVELEDISVELLLNMDERTARALAKQLAALSAENSLMLSAIHEIAPWLSASLDGDSCEEYRQAADRIMEIDIRNSSKPSAEPTPDPASETKGGT